MAKSKKPDKVHLHLNLTAMLDVVFNLIFFFISITNMAGGELPPMSVPDPVQSQARDVLERKKVTVNVLPEGTTGMASNIRIGSTDIAPTDAGRITELLQAEIAANPQIEIDLRVDHTVHYDAVRPVMNAITAVGIKKINLVANQESK
jgi:biopolymer transport protein ExbD